MKRFVDFCWRQGLRVASVLARAVWYVCRIETRGASVAVWHDGELLLVKNSYRPFYCLPGGLIGRREEPVDAACRELFEEAGVRVSREQLALRQVTRSGGPGHVRNRTWWFECFPAERPEIRIDHREIVWGGFLPPEEALRQPLAQYLADFIETSVSSDTPTSAEPAHDPS